MAKIRSMAEDDREEVAKMMKTFYASPAVMTNGSAEIFDADISACVSQNPFLEGLIFELGGEIAGYAMLAHSFSTEFGKPCVWVEDIYVKPEFRRKGIGREFFEYLQKRFGGCVIRLEAERENTPAVELYKKCGFEEMGYLEMIKGD